jgi:hypothetical protein
MEGGKHVAVSHARLLSILHHIVIRNATTSNISNFNPFSFLARVSQNKSPHALVTATSQSSDAM